MRYIYYIFIIILVTTLGVWGANRALTPDFSEEAALTVNNRIISQAELESRKKYSPYHFRSREDFLNDLITRELLIQEARRRGIDRDEAFRMTMEDQYEQALIKQVMDHRMVEINIEITEQERTDFQRASLNRYQLQQLNYASPDGATAGAVKSRQQMNENFLDLPALWQLQLLSLNTGESSSPFPLDNGYCVLKILGITPLASPGRP